MNQKGFAPILIVTIIAALVGGYLIYQNQNQPKPIPSTLQTIQSLPTPIASDETVYTETTRSANWKTYTSVKFNFLIKYPNDWQYLEVPNEIYKTATDEVWLLPKSSTLPPPQTGTMPAIVIRISSSDPNTIYQSQNFNNFKSEPFQFGTIMAQRVSGISKASLSEESAIIGKIGSYYITILNNKDSQVLYKFNQILSTFKFLQ